MTKRWPHGHRSKPKLKEFRLLRDSRSRPDSWPILCFSLKIKISGLAKRMARDVDTYAYLTQPLDILGKRKQRIAQAEQGVNYASAQYELARRQIVQNVKQAYWAARGAQEIRDVLKATVENFQGVIDYHSAQFSVGAISEQDFLRVRLEGERLQIAANLAVIETTRARVQLFRAMGQTDFSEVILTELLDANQTPLVSAEIQQVLAQRVEMKVANAALAEAQAKARLEDVSSRPDLNMLYGYKRTQLPDTTTGTNTALAGLQITLPDHGQKSGEPGGRERGSPQATATTGGNAGRCARRLLWRTAGISAETQRSGGDAATATRTRDGDFDDRPGRLRARRHGLAPAAGCATRPARCGVGLGARDGGVPAKHRQSGSRGRSQPMKTGLTLSLFVSTLLVVSCNSKAPGSGAEPSASHPATSRDEIVLSAAEQKTGMIQTEAAALSSEPDMLRVTGRIALADDRTWRVGVRTDGLVMWYTRASGTTSIRDRYWPGTMPMKCARPALSIAPQSRT